MNKQEFLNTLSSGLCALSEEERKKSLEYYEEIIVDRIEDGMSEEEAVAALGDINDIINDIMMDVPLPKLIRVKVNDNKRRMNNNALWITIMILGFPIWFPIVITLISVILVLYIVIWSVIIVLYASELSLGLAGVAGIVGGIISCFTQGMYMGLLILGSAMIALGAAVLLFKPMVLLSKQIICFTVWIFKKIKSLFIVRKEVKEI